MILFYEEKHFSDIVLGSLYAQRGIRKFFTGPGQNTHFKSGSTRRKMDFSLL